mmetsp:Transcript_3018/g.5339  ORF Transcript_3018/g.5339 Transcript_3018/m.5339 type:complete len:166 (+) Transcript_3018:93-590(+)
MEEKSAAVENEKVVVDEDKALCDTLDKVDALFKVREEMNDFIRSGFLDLSRERYARTYQHVALREVLRTECDHFAKILVDVSMDDNTMKYVERNRLEEFQLFPVLKSHSLRSAEHQFQNAIKLAIQFINAAQQLNELKRSNFKNPLKPQLPVQIDKPGQNVVDEA